MNMEKVIKSVFLQKFAQVDGASRTIRMYRNNNNWNLVTIQSK